MISPQLRVEKGVFFVDESGQLRAPRDGQPEIGVIASLVIPDTEEHHRALGQLVRELRRRVLGDPDSNRTLKAKLIDRESYCLLASEIRKRWVYGHKTLAIQDDTPDGFRTAFRTLVMIVKALTTRSTVTAMACLMVVISALAATTESIVTPTVCRTVVMLALVETIPSIVTRTAYLMTATLVTTISLLTAFSSRQSSRLRRTTF